MKNLHAINERPFLSEFEAANIERLRRALAGDRARATLFPGPRPRVTTEYFRFRDWLWTVAGPRGTGDMSVDRFEGVRLVRA